MFLFLGSLVLVGLYVPAGAHWDGDRDLDSSLRRAFERWGFTGTIQSKLETRLGRPLNQKLADLGRLLFFDKIMSLHNTNSCAGCHSPDVGFGDTQSIAIGVQSNEIVGPNRQGPRNQRRSPMVVNSGFFPKLMWNGRFVALSGDPFDNSQGFQFPDPEATTAFPPGHPEIATLLAAQGHMPQTELVEMSGFSGTMGTIGPRFDQFDDTIGDIVPADMDGNGFRNEEIREAVLARLNTNDEYLRLFGEVFNGGAPFAPGGITFPMIGSALAEFQLSLTFADAPIDRFARGDDDAMTPSMKRGALLFFGKAGCVDCHSVAGASNEMFSDFENHVLAVPQIAPEFGVGKGNVIFDGPSEREDFGAEQITGDSQDRYKFRTSPLRNVALQPTFFHNGAFTRLEEAIEHHLKVFKSVITYSPRRAGVDSDLWKEGPMLQPLLRLDRRIKHAPNLSPREFRDLLVFVRDGLLDERAKPENLCKLVPATLPSGRTQLTFEGCQPQ